MKNRLSNSLWSPDLAILYEVQTEQFAMKTRLSNSLCEVQTEQFAMKTRLSNYLWKLDWAILYEN